MAEKNIIQFIISFKNNPLVEYGEDKETFNICCKYLKKIQLNSNGSFTLDEYIIYYLNENNINYVIMTNENYPKSNIIVCINDIKNEFESCFPNKQFENICNLGLQKEFKDKLKSKCGYYDKHIVEDNEIDDIDEMFKENNDVLNSIDNLSEPKSIKSKKKSISKFEIENINNNVEKGEFTNEQNNKNTNCCNHCCCIIF